MKRRQNSPGGLWVGQQILYQRGAYWVCRAVGKGFEIYKDGITHATRCAVIGFDGVEGLRRAIAEIDRRINGG